MYKIVHANVSTDVYYVANKFVAVATINDLYKVTCVDDILVVRLCLLVAEHKRLYSYSIQMPWM